MHAEPVSPALLRSFSEAFAPCGFRERAFYPVYGLAEATVAVTFPRKLDPVKVDRIINDIQSNVFVAYVLFTDKTPASLTRGQTVTVELSFSSPTESLNVAKGSFYQHTAGRLVYLIAPDGKIARKVEVRLGSQNPRQVQVLDCVRRHLDVAILDRSAVEVREVQSQRSWSVERQDRRGRPHRISGTRPEVGRTSQDVGRTIVRGDFDRAPVLRWHRKLTLPFGDRDP